MKNLFNAAAKAARAINPRAVSSHDFVGIGPAVHYRGFSTKPDNDCVRRVELPKLISERVSEYFHSLKKDSETKFVDVPKLKVAEEFGRQIGIMAKQLADGGDKESAEFLKGVDALKEEDIHVLLVGGMPFSGVDDELLDKASRTVGVKEEVREKILQAHIPMIYATAGIGILCGYKVLDRESQNEYKRVLSKASSYELPHCDGGFGTSYKKTDMFSLSFVALDKKKTPTLYLPARDLYDALSPKAQEALSQPIFYGIYNPEPFPIFYRNERGKLQINFRLEEALNFGDSAYSPGLLSDSSTVRPYVMELCRVIMNFQEKKKESPIEYEAAGDAAFIDNKGGLHGVNIKVTEGERVASKLIFQDNRI